MTTIEIQTQGRGPSFRLTHWLECDDCADFVPCFDKRCVDGAIPVENCDEPCCHAEWEQAGVECGCGNRHHCPPCDVLRANAYGPPTLEQHRRAESYSASVFGLSADSVAA